MKPYNFEYIDHGRFELRSDNFQEFEDGDYYPSGPVDALVEALREIGMRPCASEMIAEALRGGPCTCSRCIANYALSAWEQSGNTGTLEERPCR